MRGVGNQSRSREIFAEQPLAECDRVGARHALDAGCLPDLLGCLDDEGAGVAVELVRVRLKPAPLGFLEGEGECIEDPPRAQPDVAAAAPLDLRLEHSCISRANRAVDTVAGHDQIAFAEGGLVAHLGIEYQPHTEGFATPLQDVQQALAADAAEAMSSGGDRAALEVDVDVVPVTE